MSPDQLQNTHHLCSFRIIGSSVPLNKASKKKEWIWEGHSDLRLPAIIPTPQAKPCVLNYIQTKNLCQRRTKPSQVSLWPDADPCGVSGQGKFEVLRTGRRKDICHPLFFWFILPVWGPFIRAECDERNSEPDLNSDQARWDQKHKDDTWCLIDCIQCFAQFIWSIYLFIIWHGGYCTIK